MVASELTVANELQTIELAVRGRISLSKFVGLSQEKLRGRARCFDPVPRVVFDREAQCLNFPKISFLDRSVRENLTILVENVQQQRMI